jgi:predicted NBD/HSP70 family sugar kinase
MFVGSGVNGRHGGSGSSDRIVSTPRVDAEFFNLALVLNLIRSGVATTRQEIERSSNLGRAIVVDRLNRLLDLGLIEEGALGPSKGGRAPRSLRFNDSAGVVMLAAVEATTIGIATADLSGRLMIQHHEALEMGRDPEAFFDRLVTLFDWVVDNRAPTQEIWAIGVSVSGLIQAPAGQPFSSPSFQGIAALENFPLVERLTARYGAPVWVRGSIPMKTLGEQRAGAGKGIADMIYVDLGDEIMCGLISGGHLHTGSQGAAGMIGHVMARDHDHRLCRCGNVGCLETLVGWEAVLREATDAAHSSRSRLLGETFHTTGELTIADVGAAAQRGDAVSADLMARIGRLVGESVADLTNAFNPSLIVVSGAMAQASDIVLATFRESVYRRSHPLVARDLSIVRSQLGGSAPLVGTAISVSDELFSTGILSFWVAHGSPLKHPEVAGNIERLRAVPPVVHRNPGPPDTTRNKEDVEKARQ